MKKMDELMRAVSKEHGINLEEEDMPLVLEWKQIGAVSTSTGTLAIEGVHPSHLTQGVMASTAYGDGEYPVYALKGAGGDRVYGILVVTGDEEDMHDCIRQIMRGEQPTSGVIAKQFGDPSDPVE